MSTPWLPRGRTLAGADCVGLMLLYAAYRHIAVPDVEPLPLETRDELTAAMAPLLDPFPANWAEFADHVVVFADGSGRYVHLAAITPAGRLLHHTAVGARCDNTPELLRRIGLRPVGMFPLNDPDRVAQVLSLPGLAGIETIILIVLAVVSLAVSVALMPKLGALNAGAGRYGFNGLITQNSSQVPIADVLGKVWVAGNLAYQDVMDQTATVTDTTLQKTVRVVVLAAGPIQDFGYAAYEVRLNGIALDDPYWYSHSSTFGLEINPAQTYLDTMAARTSGASNQPSVTFYDGSARPDVPLDIRATFLRDAPLWGFNGCATAWFRLVDSAKYSQFNLLCYLKGRLCRTFSSAGWDRTTVTNESLAGADGGKTQFLLAHTDIESVSAVTVNGTSYTLMDATHQSGNVYWLNRTKGFLEFLTAPAPAATILCSYVAFARAWTQGPASHVAYLLTELDFGKGLAEGSLDWASFVAAQTWYAASVTTVTSTGTYTGARFTTNYVVDQRATLLDHLKAVLDAAQSALVISNGQLSLRPRMTASSVFSFTVDNILADSFSASQPDRATAPNQLTLTFHDSGSFSAESAVELDDPDAQADLSGLAGIDGVINQALKFPAIDSVPQATRVAQQLLAELALAWQCQLTTTVKGLALQPGDLVDVTHPAQPSWSARLMRITELTLDPEERLQLKLQDYIAPAA